MRQQGLARSLALALVGLALALPASAAPDRIRFLEGPAALTKLSPEKQAAPVQGYLSTEQRAAIASSVQPPPVAGTQAAKAETELFQYLQGLSATKRWQVALDDDATVYPRFTDQIGFRLDRETTPALVALLNRVAEDTMAIAAEAKALNPRLRPYQVAQLGRVCGFARPPAPDAAAKGTGYPSGHAAVAWGTALVLVEVVPGGAQAIIGRAVSFGQSRVVCGLHYPADIEAGQFIGSEVLAKAFEAPDFRRDLACARREVEALRNGLKPADLPACATVP